MDLRDRRDFPSTLGSSVTHLGLGTTSRFHLMAQHRSGVRAPNSHSYKKAQSNVGLFYMMRERRDLNP